MSKQDERLRPADALNSGANIPAIRLVRENPKSAALLSKLTQDQRAPQRQDVLESQGAGLNAAGLRSIVNDGIQSVNDSETVRQLLADTDLAAQILVSVILSPQDMLAVEPGYQSKLTRWDIPHEVNNSLTNAVRTYFEEVYKITPKLPTIVEDVLFKRGCYPIAVLPENAIDDMIHNNGGISTESFANMTRRTFDILVREDGNVKSLGILGPTDVELKAQEKRAGGYQGGLGLALEHLMTNRPDKNWNPGIVLKYVEKEGGKEEIFDTKISVSDNIHLLKSPKIATAIREHKTQQIIGRNRSLAAESIRSKLSLGAESTTIRVPSPIEMATGVYTGNSANTQQFHKGKTTYAVVKEVKSQDKLKRRSVGMPLEIHFPSESVIPVHVPNQPSKQIGFFVMLDVEGNPINRGQGINHFRQLGQGLTSNSFASSMIQRAGMAMNDNSNLFSGAGGATMGRMYGQMLERDLIQRLKNGLVGNNVSLAGSEEIYLLMLCRSLANQNTQILYIPAEYMTYIALDYNTSGTGKSLLDNTKIIDSMQANLLVGSVMGALRNSIGRTKVDIKLDPDTPDPRKAIEQTIGEIIRTNGDGFPLGMINPTDIKDGLIRSQFQFGISGHPGLPDTEVAFSENNTNYTPPDKELMEDLRKRRLMAFYLTPEQVDAATGADFATSVANNSTLLSKRAMVIQGELTPQISAHLRKHAINNADLIDELVQIIQGSFEEIVSNFKDDEQLEMFDGTSVTKKDLKEDMLVKSQFIRELIEDFIGGFELTLPSPDTVKSETTGELYKKQSELVEAVLKDWISEDMMSAEIVGEEMAGHMRVVFAQYKSFFMRQWQVKNGLLPEMTKLTSVDEDGETELDMAEIQATHNASMMEGILKLLTSNKKQKEKNDKELQKAGVAEGDATPADSSADAGGGDDFNFDMGGVDETNPEDPEAAATPEEETPEAEAEPENPDEPKADEEKPEDEAGLNDDAKLPE